MSVFNQIGTKKTVSLIYISKGIGNVLKVLADCFSVQFQTLLSQFHLDRPLEIPINYSLMSLKSVQAITFPHLIFDFIQ